MKSIFKTILATSMALAMAFTIAIPAQAANKAQGPGGGGGSQTPTGEVKIQVGPNVNAIIKDGVLTLKGTGTTWDCSEVDFMAAPQEGNDKAKLKNYSRWGKKSTEVKRIVIEKGITRVGSCLFYGINAQNIQFYMSAPGEENALTSIGNRAFRYDYAVKTVSIPRTVTTIEEYAFDHCSNVTKIDLLGGKPMEIPALTTIGKFAFYKNKVSSVVIPANVRAAGCSTISVEDSAFAQDGGNDGSEADDGHNQSYQNNQPKLKYQVIIKLDANGGSVSQPVMVRATGNKYEKLPTPKRSGYTFAGWYSNGKKITESSTVKYEHKTLTAKWSQGLSAPSIKSLSRIHKGFKITVKNLDSSASKYIIQYSTDKGFNNCKSITKSKSSKTTYVEKLKAGKTYYVRVRALKGSKYSKWSSVKSVKTGY